MDRNAWIKKLIDWGLQEIDRRYGPGNTHPLPYHTTEHALDVMSAAKDIGQKAAVNGKIDLSFIPLLELAACYHDIVHDLPEKNEEASAELLAQKMQETGVFTEDDIDFCTECILATRYQVKYGHFIQAVTHKYHTRIMADADLASLGREFDIYSDRTAKLSAEEGKAAELPDQIAFLQNHNFHTPEATLLFPHKQANIARLQKPQKSV